MEDHVHLLFPLPRTKAVAEVVKEIKAISSAWIRKKFANKSEFAWQAGYGVFSVSSGHREAVIQYIANQREHHQKSTFEDEYLGFLARSGVAYDKRFVWD